jgi:hypothetical protein
MCVGMSLCECVYEKKKSNPKSYIQRESEIKTNEFFKGMLYVYVYVCRLEIMGRGLLFSLSLSRFAKASLFFLMNEREWIYMDLTRTKK